MKQVYVGNYVLGSAYVDLYLRPGTGGEFWFLPEPGCVPRIKVGADYDRWDEVTTCLLHEALELQFSTMECRLQTDYPILSGDRFVFHANHYQFGRVCEAVGCFLAECLPELGKQYREWKRKPKKRRRR